MTKPLVIYHANCQDGHTAAWVMRGWFEARGIEAEYFAATYAPEGKRVELPEVRMRDVWMVDFCTSREQLIEIKANARSFVVLDHHKTAQAACEGLDFCTFDMERSGAMLAWNHCWPGGTSWGLRPAPWIVEYVQDRDLWRFVLPQSKEVNAYLQSRELTFENWDRCDGMKVGDAALLGRGALDYIERYVREMKLQARRATFAGHADVPIVNAPYISISELVGAMAEGVPLAVGWFQNAQGKYVYSLRSRGDFDVSALAKQFGGGGHKNAAGFTVAGRVHE